MRRQSGFTLMEVLVALAVVAIALGAIIQSIGNSASHAGYLREKTLAHWVAMNRIAEIQVKNEWPSTGSSTGKEEMAGHEWHWRLTVTEGNAQLPNVRQVEVEVRANSNDKSPLATALAAVGKPEG